MLQPEYVAGPFPRPGEAVCACGHAVDIHELDEALLVPDLFVGDDWHFAWRMRCRGVFYPAHMDALLMVQHHAYMECSCSTVTPKEEDP